MRFRKIPRQQTLEGEKGKKIMAKVDFSRLSFLYCVIRWIAEG
jgi:hypothetical protein